MPRAGGRWTREGVWADGGMGVTDSPLRAVQPPARCVHVARVRVRVRECLGARAPRVRPRPGIPPWKRVGASGSREKLSAAAALQPRPGGQAWETARPDAFAVREGPTLLRGWALASRCATTLIWI